MTNMRKSLARSENFLTGDVVEMEKLKPIVNMQGKTTIQLFDKDTGKEVQRVESENFISKVPLYLAKGFQKMIFMSDYAYLPKEGTDAKVDSNLVSALWNSKIANMKTIFGEGNIPIVGSPFRYLLLTDYAGAEQPLTEMNHRGNQIGYALKESPYIGDSTKQGTVNTAESYGAYGQQHWVFDFPTHAANGVFQSLYWSYHPSENYPLLNEAYYMQLDYPEETYYRTSDLGKGRGIKKIGDKWYVTVGSSREGKKTAICEYSMNMDNKTAEFIRACHIENEISDFYVDGDYVWARSEYETIYKFDWNGVKQTLPNGETYQYIYRLNGCSDYSYSYKEKGIIISGNDLYVSSTGDSNKNYETHIIRIDKNTFTVLDIIDHMDFGAGKFQKYENGYKYGLYFLNSQMKRDANVLRPTSSSGRYLYFDDSNVNAYEFTDLDGEDNKFEIKRWKWGSIAARNLLPAPVEKTSQNTMKITYDFIYDVPPIEW